MSRGYDWKTSPLQALDSDRLNSVAGWISHAVERTKFLPDANSIVDFIKDILTISGPPH